MNGHSSNIGYNLFISFTKFFSKSLPRWFDSSSVHEILDIYLYISFIPTPIACEGRRSF